MHQEHSLGLYKIENVLLEVYGLVFKILTQRNQMASSI